MERTTKYARTYARGLIEEAKRDPDLVEFQERVYAEFAEEDTRDESGDVPFVWGGTNRNFGDYSALWEHYWSS